MKNNNQSQTPATPIAKTFIVRLTHTAVNIHCEEPHLNFSKHHANGKTYISYNGSPAEKERLMEQCSAIADTILEINQPAYALHIA
jgi:hypothetical protein